MSATLDTVKLQKYFSEISNTPSRNVPIIKCIYKIYNVVEVYLEDLENLIGFKVSVWHHTAFCFNQ